MIWFLLLLHLAACVVVALVGRRVGLLLAAVAPAVTAAWAIGTLVADVSPATARLEWVPGLDLVFAFEVGPLAALLTVVVSGIGALVFVYASGYFGPDAPHLGRFGATLLAFSTAMVGLVWSANVWTLFVFWELTSITSFLLVGHKSADATARLAARRALLITVSGGLALLAAFVLLVDASPSDRLSEMPPIVGAAGTVAAVAVLAAAATKSAQVPFHVWLPGAMAAPTPVSAYLHSATMVKAGVILVAVAAPVFVETTVWTPLGVTIGLASMLWGAVGALRQVDGKLILAWGTISQLGLMIALLALGEPKATFAAVSLLVAHAAFKAALFMVIGVVDVRTGTRDVRELSGLWRSMPTAFAVAVLAGLSMAGAPPVLGFASKEAAVEAVLGLDGTSGLVVAAVVIGGSVLTVAYTLRFVIGVFGPGRGADGEGAATPVAPSRPAMEVPALTLAVIGPIGFVALGLVNDAVRPAVALLDPKAEVYELLRWPGLTTGFMVSMGILAVGAALGWALARRDGSVPRPLGAEAVDGLVDGVLVAARVIAGRVQHGSLPIYLVTMAVVASAATLPFVGAVDVDALVAWDTPVQAVLGALVVAAALASARLDSRLGAALGLGLVGLGVAGLFVAQGAPDLALTQLLVETVVVVGFVVGLGHLTRRFPAVGARWRTVRLLAAAAMGTLVAVALAASASSPSGEPPVEDLSEAAVDIGGGNNVVNVVLTDTRALDTMGEVVVLVVVAVGILALAAAGRRGPDPTDAEVVDRSGAGVAT